MQRDMNYGIEREPGGLPPERPRAAAAQKDTRVWAALAHLSIFLNLLIPFLGPVAAFAMWLAQRDSSRVAASHALRSMWYQVSAFAVIVAGWTITVMLTFILVGFLLIPVMLLLTFAPLAHASYAAYRAYREEDFHYL